MLCYGKDMLNIIQISHVFFKCCFKFLNFVIIYFFKFKNIRLTLQH